MQLLSAAVKPTSGISASRISAGTASFTLCAKLGLEHLGSRVPILFIKTLPHPRTVAMEAPIFTGWIYDHLLPHAKKVKVAHPLMLRAISAAKKKNESEWRPCDIPAGSRSAGSRRFCRHQSDRFPAWP